MNELSVIASKWRQLGTQFGFEGNQLDEIQMDRFASKDCLMELITRKKARMTNFWWTDIVKALHAINENTLADKICQRFRIVQSVYSGIYNTVSGVAR